MSLGRTPGADLVKFYAKDGNRGNDQFSYVFRLNKANVAYARDNDLTTVMQLLGHASATHTARYVSLAHQNLGNSTHVLNTIFSSVVGKGSNVNIPALISKAMGDLNATDGALATDFLKAVTEEGLDATQEALKFKGDINIFNPKMNRPASNKGFTVSNVMQVNEKIDAAREDLLNQIINSSNSKRMVDVTGYGGAEKWPTDMPDFQGWDIEKHIIALEDINKFASFLETAKLTRQLIANSKEVVGSKVNYTPAQKARIKKMKDEALIAQRVLDEWLETSISLSKRHLKAISKDKYWVKDTATGTRVPWDNKITGHGADIYPYLEGMVTYRANQQLARRAAVKRGFVGSKSATMTISSLPFFKHFYQQGDIQEKLAELRHKATLASGKLPKSSPNAGNIKPGLKSQIEELERQLRDIGTSENIFTGVKLGEDVTDKILGYVVADPKRAGENWIISAVEVVDRAAIGAAKTKFVQEDALNSIKPQDVMGFRLQKLARKWHEADGIVTSGNDDFQDISRIDFEKWRVQDMMPFPKELIRAPKMGQQAYESKMVVSDRIHHWGLLSDEGFTANDMKKQLLEIDQDVRGHFIKEGSTKGVWRRLVDNGYVEKVATRPGERPRWNWTAEIQELTNAKGGIDDASYGHAGRKLRTKQHDRDLEGPGRPGRKPPSGPGPTHAAPDSDLPDGNKINIRQYDGTFARVGDIIHMPRGMKVAMKFAFDNGLVHDLLQKPLFGTTKVLRTLMGNTFAPTDAAKLRWAYVKSLGEARRIASSVTQIMDEIYTITGADRNNIGRDLIVNEDVLGKYNPQTGRFGGQYADPDGILPGGGLPGRDINEVDWDSPAMMADMNRRGTEHVYD